MCGANGGTWLRPRECLCSRVGFNMFQMNIYNVDPTHMLGFLLRKNYTLNKIFKIKLILPYRSFFLKKNHYYNIFISKNIFKNIFFNYI